MASLSIRKLDERTLERLRLRAARHGVSVEEEVRRIIGVAVVGERDDFERDSNSSSGKPSKDGFPISTMLPPAATEK